MTRVMLDFPANPHSADHAEGWRSAKALEEARYRASAAFGAELSELIFTSGATESNNLALFGLVKQVEQVCALSIDHASLLSPIRRLAESGTATALLPVNEDGQVRLESLEEFVQRAPSLVAVGLVNSEIGVIQPIREIAEICARHNAMLHIDAAQALGRMKVDILDWGCASASFSAHKAYGPKGIGGLVLARDVQSRLTPISYGGGQEFGLRSGTAPVYLAIAFAAAAERAGEQWRDNEINAHARRDRLLARLKNACPRMQINGGLGDCRIGGNLNIAFPDVEAQALLPRVASTLSLSTSSACSSGAIRDSHVLTALGLPSERIRRSLRLCFGRTNRDEDVDIVADTLLRAVNAAS